MPSDLMFKTLNTLHRGLLRFSGWQVGHAFQHMPIVELTTTGRRSGQRHTVLLASALQQDERIVVASRGGDSKHPAWFLNLRDNPDVEVSLGGGPARQMRARVASGDERAELWERLTAAHKNYAGYQTKTTREIPVVVLEP